MDSRLAKLRSFIWWTLPLYVVVLLAGLYASGFSFAPEMALLLAVLVAFALLDAIVLRRIRSIQDRPTETSADVRATVQQIERLARFLILAAVGLAAAFGVALAFMIIT